MAGNVVRWVFHDPVVVTDYTVELNPADSDLPGNKRDIKYQNTCGPNGAVLAFIGRDIVQQIRISGTSLSKSHYQAWLTWSAKRYPITVTDDLGNVFSVLVDEYAPKRKRSSNHPWAMSYSATLTVLSFTVAA